MSKSYKNIYFGQKVGAIIVLIALLLFTLTLLTLSYGIYLLINSTIDIDKESGIGILSLIISIFIGNIFSKWIEKRNQIALKKYEIVSHLTHSMINQIATLTSKFSTDEDKSKANENLKSIMNISNVFMNKHITFLIKDLIDKPEDNENLSHLLNELKAQLN